MNKLSTSDVCVVGCGLVGASVALAIAKAMPLTKVVVIDREETTFKHNSSRNSGVLHSGIYYKEGSLKAKLCAPGNRMMKQFIKDNNLWIRNCGKVVIPRNSLEAEKLPVLLSQGHNNGANVRMISRDQCRELEPTAKLYDGLSEVLHTPDTAVCELDQVIKAIKHEMSQVKNIEIKVNQAYGRLVDKSDSYVIFEDGDGNEHKTGMLINCAGYDSLRIAQEYGFSAEKELVFLKGYYLGAELKDLEEGVYPRMLIYPVPPIAGNIFLGVHTTTTKDYLKFGPTAFPALSGTHYGTFTKVSPTDALKSIKLFASIMMSPKAGFYLSQFISEARKMANKDNIIEDVRSIYSVDPSRLGTMVWQKSAIRTQMIDKRTKDFEADFIIDGGRPSIHVLNCVSPGWTSAFSMADHIVKMIV